MKQITLKQMGTFLDDLEQQMDLIDKDREKPIFIRRLRDEWEDAFIKRYVNRNGEIGAEPLEEEQKQMSLYRDNFSFKYERMQAQFAANKKNNEDIGKF